MRYFYDCEFIDTGSTIDLISIGIVCEDGRELYLQSVEFDPEKANDWVKENVFPHLLLCPCCGHKVNHEDVGKCRDRRCPWRTRAQIRDEIKLFFFTPMSTNPNDSIELWGYYSSYDHVAFCQLFGAMADLPKGYPMLTWDLRQLLDTNHLFDIRQPDDSPHNALEDARWIAETYMRLV